MSKKPAKPASLWFDEASHTPLIADRAQRMESFVAAVAEGQVDEAEIKGQERRLVALMEEVEPQLTPELHAKVTDLLCELTVYNFMHAMHSVQQARPKTKFRG